MSLQGCHVVIVSGVDEERAAIERALKEVGAIPHAAKDQTQALGRIVELFHHRIIPRAFITDWDLCLPGTDEHRFYELIGLKESATAYSLIKHIRALDATIAILVFLRNSSIVKTGANSKYGFQTLLWPVTPAAAIQRLLDDPRMVDMRTGASVRRRTEEFSADDSDEYNVTPPVEGGSAL